MSIASRGCIPGKAALAAALLALAVTAPAQAGADRSSLPDVVDIAVAAGNFKTLATALQAAGLVKTDIQAGNGVIHVIDAVLMPRR